MRIGLLGLSIDFSQVDKPIELEPGLNKLILPVSSANPITLKQETKNPAFPTNLLYDRRLSRRSPLQSAKKLVQSFYKKYFCTILTCTILVC